MCFFPHITLIYNFFARSYTSSSSSPKVDAPKQQQSLQKTKQPLTKEKESEFATKSILKTPKTKLGESKTTLSIAQAISFNDIDIEAIGTSRTVMSSSTETTTATKTMISTKEDEKNDNKKNETIEERKRVEKLKSKAEKEAKKVRTTFYSSASEPFSKLLNPYLDINIQ